MRVCVFDIMVIILFKKKVYPVSFSGSQEQILSLRLADVAPPLLQEAQ